MSYTWLRLHPHIHEAKAPIIYNAVHRLSEGPIFTERTTMQLPIDLRPQANTHFQNQDPAHLSALDNPTILGQIFEHLHPNSTLLDAALTCRTFRDPALNVLWRSLDTLLPLLKLLPSFKLVNGVYVNDFQMTSDLRYTNDYRFVLRSFKENRTPKTGIASTPTLVG